MTGDVGVDSAEDVGHERVFFDGLDVLESVSERSTVVGWPSNLLFRCSSSRIGIEVLVDAILDFLSLLGIFLLSFSLCCLS